MAMEVNSKNLHKHALPLLLVAVGILITSAIVLAQYQPPLSNGLEALFGQKAPAGTLPNISNLGSETSQNL
jgi:hypothetical protein